MLKTHGIFPDQYKTLAGGATSHRLEALKNGTVDFSLLTLPFNLLAKDAGLLHLDRPFETIGIYQSTGGFVHSSWALENASTLSRYLAAYIEGLRWVLEPAFETQVVGLIETHLKLSHAHALECYAQVTHPTTGFFKDAKLCAQGMKKVLELRQKFEGNSLEYAISDFYDDLFYQSALDLI
jgi:hypothetical protein